MSKTLLVSLGGYPEPPDVTEDAATGTNAGAVLDVWHSLIPPHAEDGDGDREDFWEMAYRLYAAVTSGADALYISVDDAAPRRLATDPYGWHLEDETFTLASMYQVAASYPAQYALYGPVTRWSPGNLVRLPQEATASEYPLLAPFSTYSGRPFDLVGIGEDGEMPEEATLDFKVREYRDRGVSRVALKSSASKKMDLITFDISDGVPEDISHHIADYAMNLFGRPRAFILQGYVEMEYEYRVFVVGGKPVTGAGCLEEYTPRDAKTGIPFDSAMRQNRKQRSAIEDQPERVDGYVEFATRVAADFAEQSGLTDYVLDVATDAVTGDPLVIELNGLLNSGLYASDPTLVTKGLVRCAE